MQPCTAPMSVCRGYMSGISTAESLQRPHSSLSCGHSPRPIAGAFLCLKHGQQPSRPLRPWPSACPFQRPPDTHCPAFRFHVPTPARGTPGEGVAGVLWRGATGLTSQNSTDGFSDVGSFLESDIGLAGCARIAFHTTGTSNGRLLDPSLSALACYRQSTFRMSSWTSRFINTDRLLDTNPRRQSLSPSTTSN
jgi:hypothetical protein